MQYDHAHIISPRNHSDVAVHSAERPGRVQHANTQNPTELQPSIVHPGAAATPPAKPQGLHRADRGQNNATHLNQGTSRKWEFSRQHSRTQYIAIERVKPLTVTAEIGAMSWAHSAEISEAARSQEGFMPISRRCCVTANLSTPGKSAEVWNLRLTQVLHMQT